MNNLYQDLLVQAANLLSLFKIPKGLAEDIKRLQNQFLWRGQEEKKPHLINWHTVFMGKTDGGLAFGGIVYRTKALPRKWLWRFPLEQHTLWAAVIRSEFGDYSNCCLCISEPLERNFTIPTHVSSSY